LHELLEEIRADSKLTKEEHQDELISYAKQWSVSADDLEEKTAEMINTSIFFAAAAQKPPKQVKFDFFFIHCVNSSIFWPTFNQQAWLSTENKVRLLKFKGYLDLHTYATHGSPPLLMEEVATYVPKKLEKGDAEWPGVFDRIFEFDDDSHAVKLARAVRNGELLTDKWAEEKMGKIKGFMWEKIGNMVVDSVEDTGATWVRSAGFDEAWEGFEDRPRETRL
jgi:hypothetical protein